MPHHILVADDDPHIREVICFALEKAGMETHVGRRRRRRPAARSSGATPDLVVLDVGMPEMDGLEVCRLIRRTSDVPILFLSARDEEIDRILGLEMGGDDYVTKPFSPRELVARVNVILRRARAAPAERDCAGRLRMAGWSLDAGAAHRASFDGKALALTAIEFAIVRGLLGEAGACAEPRELVEASLRRQHPCRRPHHRQPHPQHPRQAGGGGLRRRDRDRARRRLPARPVRRVSLTRTNGGRASASVVLAILLTVMALPLVGLFFFRIYENQLVRQTEAELIAPGCGDRRDLCARGARGRHCPPEKLGAPMPSCGKRATARQQRSSRADDWPYRPIEPSLDLAVDTDPRRRPGLPLPADARSGLRGDRCAADRHPHRHAEHDAGRLPAARPHAAW